MLNKKTIKNILLEVEATNYNYEIYLQDIINEVLNNNNDDVKYIITRENNDLHLYKYSQADFIDFLRYDYMLEGYEINDVINNYRIIIDYVQKNYIDYYVENNLTNFISIKKFRKMLYDNKSLLYKVINDIECNIRNYANNKYLVNEYNLNKKLYSELKKIQRGLK